MPKTKCTYALLIDIIDRDREKKCYAADLDQLNDFELILEDELGHTSNKSIPLHIWG